VTSPSLLRMLWLQTRAEFLKLWRVPVFSFFSLVFPVMFFALIGLGQAHELIQPGVTFGAYFVASMGAYAVSNVMVFSFGVSVANERGMKMDLLMRATPLPPVIYLLAKVITAFVFGILSLVVLFGFASLVGAASLDLGTWLTMTWRLGLGALVFIAMGFAVGYLAGPNSAVVVVNFIYLPIAFASGLFFPLQLLPEFVRNISPYLPLRYYGQLGWNAVGVKTENSVAQCFLYLAIYGVVFFAIALWAYRQEEARKFS
jgi:ABC-2 type transport system permease protein